MSTASIRVLRSALDLLSHLEDYPTVTPLILGPRLRTYLEDNSADLRLTSAQPAGPIVLRVLHEAQQALRTATRNGPAHAECTLLGLTSVLREVLGDLEAFHRTIRERAQ
jgi:hypothetical protein